jgi:DAK2 domain fusion protein YloV
MNDAAEAARTEVEKGEDDIIAVMEAAVEAARNSVANTPTLLKVLREAGVVDAGGQGVYTILEGALRYLRGEVELMRLRKPQIIVSELPHMTPATTVATVDEVPYGYCTEFMVKGEKLDTDIMKKRLMRKGESLIVVGDETAVRIHIHTLDPGNIIHWATKLGTVHQVSVRNMDEQHQDFLEMQKDRVPTADTAVITVAAGDGLKDVFASLGASAVIAGGQTMNPSTKDILQAVEAAPSEKIIILPNNKNIITTAEQVQSLTQKQVQVVPTRTIPQGVVALLAFDYEADFKTNARIMESAIPTVKSIEITRSVRSTKVNGLKIKRKQPIGILDGDLVAAGISDADVLHKIISELGMEKAEVVTIYHGESVETAEAEEISAGIAEKYPHLQVEVVRGGQPHYSYIVSVE